MISKLSPAFKGYYEVMFNTFYNSEDYKKTLRAKNPNLRASHSGNLGIVKTDDPQWSEKDRKTLTNSDYLTAEQVAKINQAFLTANSENVEIDVRDK